MTAKSITKHVMVYLCHNCLPAADALPRQWKQNGIHVITQETPCSGKTDARYLFHAFEGGARGVCVVTCLKGDCRLVEGNYRAEVRVRTVQRLLGEIGIEPQRIQLLHFSSADAPDQLERLVRETVDQICACAEGPGQSWAEPASAPEGENVAEDVAIAAK